jgi:acyl-CoA synthetase (AMP-forming)/AMP-acid ligase II
MQIRGKNIADGDLEATVERSHPALRDGSSGAFALLRAGREILVVVAEIERRSGDDRRARDVLPRDGLESFWFEHRDRSDRRRGEARPPRLEDEEVVAAIRQAIEQAHDLEVEETLLVAPGVLPRTPEGGIDRESCRAQLVRLIGEEA